jgi:hypothetical protein
MKKYIALFFVLSAFNTMACQKMTYDPWIHFVIKEQFISDGILLWHHDQGRIYGAHYVKAGELRGDKVYDCNGSLVVEKRGDSIYDKNGSAIFKIVGSRVYDKNGKVVADIRGNRVYNGDGSLYGEMK